jgi:hypothetical protein
MQVERLYFEAKFKNHDFRKIDGSLDLETRGENSHLGENYLSKGCFQNK